MFTTLDDLLACDEVDLVEVLLPHHLHAPATLAALEAGKAVSVQKPMATSLADARKMVAEADRRGRFFKLFENFVFYPPVQKARQLLDAGAIGEPLDHPHQERLRRPAARLGDTGSGPGLAAGSRTLRRRADRVRRRAP